ncbi:hypothetical protein [uncultured Deefgea sp.]|uniref:hypothetical protein n=1 Tax=uncultured Deefgea sp. TaxID=1304914 RepID=UPI002591D66B|nr:hypothetical protein [uncultured Deefgea sp.]
MGAIFSVLIGYMLFSLIPFSYMMISEYGYNKTAYEIGQVYGIAMKWPKYAINFSPEVDGSNYNNFQKSIIEIANDHDLQKGRFMLLEAIGDVHLLEFVKQNPSLNSKSFDEMQEKIRQGDLSFKSALESPAIVNAMLSRLDGMEFDDIIEEGESADQEILKVLSTR